MSDFEKRLSEALSSGAEDAPGTTAGLASGARRRARSRRRTTVAGVAAAVALAVGVPVGIVGLGSDEAPGQFADRVTDPNVGEVADTKSTRTETWRNVTLEVPADWEYGSLSGWCAGRGDLASFRVERPGVIVPAILCTPAKSYGVAFQNPAPSERLAEPGEVSQRADGRRLPEGAWSGFVTAGATDVEVTAPDRATVQAVLDSVQLLGEGEEDANGCAVRAPGDGRRPDSSQMSICRYTPDGWLEQSERLSVADTADAVSALDSAPPGDETSSQRCPLVENPPQATIITMSNAAVSRAVRYGGPCPESQGVTGGERFQKLTREVMFWALSPGWLGSLGGGVPVPRPFRSLPEAGQGASPVPVADEPRVTCDVLRPPKDLSISLASWPVSAMDGKLSGSYSDAEIRAMFVDVVEEIPNVISPELDEFGPQGARWILLAETDPTSGADAVIGLGDWSSAEGPGPKAQFLTFERAEGDLRLTSIGPCPRVDVVVPAGRTQVEIVDARASSRTGELVLFVQERGCTSKRDPSDFLGEPEIAETADRVSVRITSQAPGVEEGPVIGCGRNPTAQITVDLDEPLGDRVVIDAGTWPQDRNVRTLTEE